jgi:RimJ/RimL family protein N-acetyltransferase
MIGCTFALVRKADQNFIGMIGLHVREDHKRGEVGYWIGLPYWNQGYATEAAQRIVDFGFGQIGLNRIHAQHFASNPASGRVMQKIGMKHEGVLRQHFIRFDETRDAVCYGILRDEWENQQTKK